MDQKVSIKPMDLEDNIAIIIQKRSCPVLITEVAQSEISNVLTKKNIPSNYHLRLGVKGSVGCAGVNYLVGFDKINPVDDVYKVNDLLVIISKKDTMFLIGLQLDFINSETERGFVFGPKPPVLMA